MDKWRRATWWLLGAIAFWAVIGALLLSSLRGWSHGGPAGWIGPGVGIGLWALGTIGTIGFVGAAWLIGRMRGSASQTADNGIRKQVYDLTSSDLEQHPIWEFALDEGGEEGQDEATVRPLVNRDLVDNGEVVRATFVAADRSEFVGFVTPEPSRNPGLLQPTIVTQDGQVNFWFGWQEQGVTDSMVGPLYALLGKSPSELFPITYRVDLLWRNGSELTVFEDRVSGFGWLPDLGSGEARQRL